MNGNHRQHYILTACLVYALLGVAWIFLSDRLLAHYTDLQTVVRFSSAKGVFFILVSLPGFFFAMVGVPSNTPKEQNGEQLLSNILTAQLWPHWLAIVFALVLIGVTEFVRSHLAIVFDNSQVLILFMVPVIVSAMLGGLWAGLAATFAVACATAFEAAYSSRFALTVDQEIFYWCIFLVNGLTVSLISEAMHLSKRQERLRSKELEKTLAELAAIERRSRSIFKNAPIAMTLTDDQQIVLSRNDRFERLFGYSAEEVPTVADWWRLAYPDSRYRKQAQKTWQAAVERALLNGGEIDVNEYSVTRKDGSERIVQIGGVFMEEGLLANFVDVTERRQIERRLWLWTESFEQAQVGLIIVDAQSNCITDVNPAFARERGYTREEMQQMPVVQLFPPERRADVQNIEDSLAISSHGVFETVHTCKDGRRFPVLADITVAQDAKHRPQSLVGIIVNITDRKRAEAELVKAQAETQRQQARARVALLNQMQDTNNARLHAETALAALRQSESRIKLFIEHAPVALAMFDRDMRYIAYSQRWLQDYNLGKRELFGLSHYQLFPEIGAEWKAVHKRGLAGEVVCAEEDRFVRLDGNEQWLRWEVRPWFSEEDIVGGIVMFTEDITARVQARIALRDSDTRMHTLIQTIPDLVWLKDFNGVYLLCNSAFERLYGAAEADIIGHTDYDFVDKETADFFRANDLKALEIKGLSSNEEWLTFATDGYRGLFQTLKTPVLHADGQVIGVLGIARDITNLRQIEEDLRAANATLETRVALRTAELQALNQSLESFVYSVSHDLKAPLRGIEGYSQLLVEDYAQALDDDGRLFISNIRNGVARMGELIDDLLAYSRMERRKLENNRLALAELIEHLLREREEDIKACAAEIRVDVSDFAVYADANGLAMVLRNLLENALKFSAKAQKPRIGITAKRENDNVIIQVADNGIGFDMMYHERIFEIFQRLHRLEDYPGTGIGLALAKKAMQRMGGDVWADSKPGQGARFFLRLPLAHAESA